MVEVRLSVFTDYIAPACHLAEPPLDALRARGVTVTYHPFELFPAPLPLPDYASAEEAEAWRSAVEPVAMALELTMRRPRRAVRTRKAHEAVRFAAGYDRAAQLHRSILRAYFEEGLDIARVDVLVRLGVELGLDRTELKVALDLDTHAAAVVAGRDAALDAGITGVPAFVSVQHGRSRALVGWHDAPALLRWLDAAGAGRPET